jgi:hypothetical protein
VFPQIVLATAVPALDSRAAALLAMLLALAGLRLMRG